jgi:hypothetical protein
MADYDLGKAHGKVVIDYEDKGGKEAQSEMGKIDAMAQKLMNTFGRLRTTLTGIHRDFGEVGARMSRTFAIITGGTAILLGLSRATTTFTGRLFQLKGGLGILSALSLTLGGLPNTVQGFPKIIKQIILLSSAITLFASSTQLLNKVFVAIGRFAASTQIIQRLTAAFPFLTSVLGDLAKRIPSIGQIGKAIDGLAKPIHTVARLALGIGAMIHVIRTGVNVAFALTKQLAKMAAAALLLDGAIKVVGGLIAAVKELSGAIGLLPGAFAVAGVALGALGLGLKGFKEALKNLDDVEKFEEAIKKLAPSAQETARQIRKMVPEFERVQRIVQQHLFADLAQDVRKLGENYFPVLQHGIGRVAIELNGIIRQFFAFANSSKTVSDVNEIIAVTIGMLRNLRGAVQPFLQGLLNITVVSAQAFGGMFGNITQTAQAFNAWTAQIRADGSLLNWIQTGVQAFKDLFAIIFNLVGIVNAFFAAFGTQGQGVLSTLRELTSQFLLFLQVGEGRQALELLAASLERIAAVAKDVLLVALQELGPVFIALRPFVEELTASIGGTLIVALKILGPLLQGIAEALSFMAPVLGPIIGFFLGLGIAGKAFVLIIGPIVAGVNLLISVFAALRTAFTIIRTAWLLLQFVFAVSPWTIIIAGIILLVTLIVLNWDKISAFLIKAWEWIKEKAIQIWNSIRDFFVGSWNKIVADAKAIWEGLKNFFGKIWEAIKFVFLNFTVVGLIIKYWDDIKNFTVNAWNAIVSFLTGIWNKIVDATRSIWEPIVSIFTSIFSIIKDLFVIFYGGLAIIAIHVWETIRDGTIAAWNAIVSFFTTIWNWITDTFHSIFDPIWQWWVDLHVAIYDTVVSAWNTISNWVSEKWAWVLAKWHEFWDPIAEFATKLWEDVKRIINDANVWVGMRLLEAWAYVQRLWHQFWDPIANFFTDIWRRISTTVSDGVNSVVEWVRGIPGRIVSAIGDLGSTLLAAGRRIIEGFLNGLKEKFKAVQDFVSGIADWIRANKGPLSYDAKLLKPAGTLIMEGLLSSMERMRPQIVGFLSGLTDDIANGLNDASGKILDANASLSSSTHVGVLNNAASAATDPATLSRLTPGLATGVPATASPAPVSGSTIVIEKLEIPVQALADPTNPIEWKKMIDAIHEGLRQWENEKK